MALLEKWIHYVMRSCDLCDIKRETCDFFSGFRAGMAVFSRKSKILIPVPEQTYFRENFKGFLKKKIS